MRASFFVPGRNLKYGGSYVVYVIKQLMNFHLRPLNELSRLGLLTLTSVEAETIDGISKADVFSGNFVK